MNMEHLYFPLYLFVALAVYFIPNWIANARKHPNANAIFITNLLLGWTFIGWVGALIWSVTAVNTDTDKARSLENTDNQSDIKQCPFCAETIKKKAKVCRYCNRDLPEEPEKPKESNILPIMRK